MWFPPATDERLGRFLSAIAPYLAQQYRVANHADQREREPLDGVPEMGTTGKVGGWQRSRQRARLLGFQGRRRYVGWHQRVRNLLLQPVSVDVVGLHQRAGGR